MPETKAKILLVDDNQMFREAISTALGESGYTVVEAADGRAALDAYYEQPFDVIITDIFMPDMDGLELLEYFQGAPDARVIVVSGGSPEGIDLIDAARELGAFRTLEKPFDLVDLEQAVQDAISRG